MFAGGVIDVLADGAGQKLHARGARKALRAIMLERCGVIVVCPEHMRQADRVFQRHAGALCEILQHGMRRIAEQRDPAVDPMLARIAVAQHPEPPVPAVANDVLRPLMNMRKTLHDFVVGYGLARHRLRRIVVIGHDEIENFPARQRVMHDVAFGAGPQRRRIPA